MSPKDGPEVKSASGNGPYYFRIYWHTLSDTLPDTLPFGFSAAAKQG
jgi:hypothetical protein